MSRAILFNLTREQISHLLSGAYSMGWQMISGSTDFLNKTFKHSSTLQPYSLFLPSKVVSLIGTSNFWAFLQFLRVNGLYSCWLLLLQDSEFSNIYSVRSVNAQLAIFHVPRICPLSPLFICSPNLSLGICTLLDSLTVILSGCRREWSIFHAEPKVLLVYLYASQLSINIYF